MKWSLDRQQNRDGNIVARILIGDQPTGMIFGNSAEVTDLERVLAHRECLDAEIVDAVRQALSASETQTTLDAARAVVLHYGTASEAKLRWQERAKKAEAELAAIDKLARTHITRTPLEDSTTGRVAVLCEELLSTVEESQRQRRRADQVADPVDINGLTAHARAAIGGGPVSDIRGVVVAVVARLRSAMGSRRVHDTLIGAIESCKSDKAALLAAFDAAVSEPPSAPYADLVRARMAEDQRDDLKTRLATSERERDQALAQLEGMRGERDSEREIAVGWQRKHEDLEVSLVGPQPLTDQACAEICARFWGRTPADYLPQPGRFDQAFAVARAAADAQALALRSVAPEARRCACGYDGRSIDELLEASSLGTPEVKAARASVPKELVDRVLVRVDDLDELGADDFEAAWAAYCSVSTPDAKLRLGAALKADRARRPACTSCEEVEELADADHAEIERLRAELAAMSVLGPTPSPIPMRIICPACGELHVDEGTFATTPHRNHSCQACGLTWQPCTLPTVGVRFLPGYRNESSASEGSQS
jgi:hypothetical protein